MNPRLEEASYNGDLDELHQLLQEDRFLLEKLSTTPCIPNNPLHIASMRGHADFVREILLRKPELAKDLNADGFSALHLAVANGHLAVVRELLRELGSHVCLARDKVGLLPIHTAAMKGRVHVLGELLDARSESARTKTCQGDTILHLAVSSNCSEAVEFLVERLDTGELLNAQNEKGNTILHLAVARKQLQILMFLVSKREIDVNSVNLRGFTPLDVLLESPREHGDFELAEMIRKAGGIETAGGEELQPLPLQSGLNSRNESSLNPRNRSEGKSFLHRIRKFFQPSNNASTMRRNNHRLKNNENSTGTLMVVATIIATITFQAGLNPPGGFKEDGEAALGDKLALFLKFDMVGLFTSLSIILLLICVTPRRKRMVLKSLICIMWVSIFSTALAFLVAVSKIFPESNHPMVLIFLKVWLWFFTIAITWAAIQSIRYLLRKVGWLKTEEEERENQEVGYCFVTGGTVTAKRIAALLLVIIVAAIVVFVCLVMFSSMGLSPPETPQSPSPAPHFTSGRMHRRTNRRLFGVTNYSSEFDGSTLGYTICNKAKNLAKISSEKKKEHCQDEEWDSKASSLSALLSFPSNASDPIFYSVTDARSCYPLNVSCFQPTQASLLKTSNISWLSGPAPPSTCPSEVYHQICFDERLNLAKYM
ncbi:uncharacterized protein [Elaeis guineensis]|uniref:uncharacterized protein isoform X1 n=1 Tax=Elaeis guineensis var. tenera TaxID=51953 RepID=UPI003C6D442A